MEEDLDTFLEDHGKPCKVGALDFVGILDAPGDLLTIGGDEVVTSEYALTVKSSVIAAASIRVGVLLTHDGVQYKARQPRAADDGQFSIIPLSKV